MNEELGILQMDPIGGNPVTYGFKFLYAALQIVGVAIIVLLVFWLTYFCGGFAWSSDPGHFL